MLMPLAVIFMVTLSSHESAESQQSVSSLGAVGTADLVCQSPGMALSSRIRPLLAEGLRLFGAGPVGLDGRFRPSGELGIMKTTEEEL